MPNGISCGPCKHYPDEIGNNITSIQHFIDFSFLFYSKHNKMHGCLRRSIFYFHLHQTLTLMFSHLKNIFFVRCFFALESCSFRFKNSLFIRRSENFKRNEKKTAPDVKLILVKSEENISICLHACMCVRVRNDRL